MSLFDFPKLLEPFVKEARAADRRRRLEYLHVIGLQQRLLQIVLMDGETNLEAAKRMSNEILTEELQRALRALEADERRG